MLNKKTGDIKQKACELQEVWSSKIISELIENTRQKIPSAKSKIDIDGHELIKEIIWKIYDEKTIFARDLEIIRNGVTKIRFSFPKYNLTKGDLGHISGAQMQIAIFQGLFLSIGLYLKNNLDSPIDYEYFINNIHSFLYRKDKKTFSKILNENEDGYLIFEIGSIKQKGEFLSITVKLIKDKQTFINGEVECIMKVNNL